MEKMIPFRYGGFHDVPRGIVLNYKGKFFYLRSSFDDDLDDYPNTYSVYLLPPVLEPVASSSSWDFIRDLGLLTYVGKIDISQVRFDETKRKELDPSILDQFLATGES